MENKVIRRGQIYYADLSPAIGSEQGGIRPVIIIQNDIGNKYSPTTIIAPLTSRQTKAKLPTHVDLCCDCLTKSSVVLLEQIRIIDKKRLTSYVGMVNDMTDIDHALKVSVGL